MRRATQKDYQPVREKTASFRTAVTKKLQEADIKDLGGDSRVHIRWDLNEAAKRDRVFLLEINGEKAYIDLEELMSYTRLV